VKFAFHVKMYQSRSDVMTRRACIINNLLSIKVVAKKWISLLIEYMLSRLLFVDVLVTGTFSESCTPYGTFW